MTPLKDMAGQTFGKLRVIERFGCGGHTSRWLVECECGKRYPVFGAALRRGQKSCASCAQKRPPFNTRQVMQLRRRGLSWLKIAERLGTDDTTLRRHGFGGDRISWIKRHAPKIEEMLAAGKQWPEISRDVNYSDITGRALSEHYSYWVGRVAKDTLEVWVQSPHGRVIKAIAEGYSVGSGCVRANVGGSTWRNLANRPLDAQIAWMLNQPLDRIQHWLERGATWKDINLFLDKPFRFGSVLEACYHARIDWDVALEPKVVEDDMAVH